MAGLPTNDRLLGRTLGSGMLWGGLPIPPAGARLSVSANANGIITPDATANPQAYPLGATKAGAKLTGKTEDQDFFVDGISAPVDTIQNALAMQIDCELVGIMDDAVIKSLMSGFGTFSTAAGYKEFAMGIAPALFEGIALLTPQREDPTKVWIWHIYKAKNTGGVAWTAAQKELGSSPAVYKGYAVPGRTPTDQVGKYWWQI